MERDGKKTIGARLDGSGGEIDLFQGGDDNHRNAAPLRVGRQRIDQLLGAFGVGRGGQQDQIDGSCFILSRASSIDGTESSWCPPD